MTGVMPAWRSSLPSRSARRQPGRLHPPPPIPGAKTSNHFQRRQHVLDDVVGMLEPDREAYQAVADTEFGALRRSKPLMRRRRRMRDEALGVAEIVADANELERILETERGVLAAFDVERDEG